ncbi:MAG: hypothetical protein RL518_543 [Pseudomonadota bacterium]|jgi:hypothetical protein
MASGPNQKDNKPANGTTREQRAYNGLSHPSNLKPWADRSLAPEDRLEAYKDFLRQRGDEISAEVQRCADDTAKILEIRDAAATQEWMAEVIRLKSILPQDFCRHVDLQEVRELLGKNFLGADAWRSQGIAVGQEPPFPVEITKELLELECPLHPGERIKDTHLMVLMPAMVNEEPYTALKLADLCVSRRGSGDNLICAMNSWKDGAWASIPQSKSEWMLMPKSDPDKRKLPSGRHFRIKNIAAQQTVHGDHYQEYREVRVVELMTAVLLNDLVNGEPRMLEATWLRCLEPNACGGRVTVGSFDSRGLLVHDGLVDGDRDYVGRALARKLTVV